MNKSILLIAGISLLTTGAFAATSDTTSNIEVKTQASVDQRVVHRGFRISTYTSNMKLEVTNTFSYDDDYRTGVNETTIHGQGTTIQLGYESVRVLAARYSVLASRTIFSAEGSSLYNDTVEGNVTFGLNQKIHFASGLNIGKITLAKNNNDNAFKDTIGIGLQTAFTYQFIKNMALEFKMTITSYNEEQDTESGTVDRHASVSGGLLGLSGTF